MKNALVLIILGVVTLGLVAFGLLSLTTSLWSALGITVAVVGLIVLVMAHQPPAVGFILLATGGSVFFLSDMMPSMTIAEGLSLVGVNP